MKELSIEGNAYDGNYKAYTELINRLEDVKNAIKKQNYGIAMDILCKPYPEYQITTSTGFKESEGLRIIKAIKYGLDHVFTNNTTVFEVTKEQCLSWLEKQGEHSNFLSKIQVGDKVTRNEDGVLVNLSQLNRVAKKDEKQGENISLPKFTFDDVLALQCAMEAAKKMQEDKELYEQLQSLHDRLHDAYWLEKQGEQKPAWSEEDERMFDAVIADIQFTQKAHNHEVNQIVYEREIDWLKSLKDRYTWKPSEEQMDAIRYVTNFDYGGYKATLVSLYEQLKKLRGGDV